MQKFLSYVIYTYRALAMKYTNFGYVCKTASQTGPKRAYPYVTDVSLHMSQPGMRVSMRKTELQTIPRRDKDEA